MLIQSLSKSELLELLVKGRKAGSTIDRSHLVKVWRLCHASDKKIHWKRVLINPNKLHKNPKFTRVIKGEEDKLSTDHPLRAHLADTDIAPDIPELSEEDKQQLDEYLQQVHHEEEHKVQTKAARQKPVKSMTSLTPSKPTAPPTVTGLNPLQIAKAKTAAQNYIRTAPWNLKKKYTADEVLDERLYNQLAKWDLYYHKPEGIRSTIFHNQLVTTLAVAIYHGFDPKDPVGSISKVPKELRASYYEPVTTTNSSALSGADKLDLSEVPADKQHLAMAINNLPTLEDIQACIRIGIIPQDVHSQNFLIHKFQTRLALSAISKDSLLDEDTRERILKDWGEETVKALAKQATYDISGSTDSFDRLITNFVQVLDNGELGYSPKLLIDSLKHLKHFSLSVLTNPQSHISSTPQSNDFTKSPQEIIESINDAYTNAATDEFNGDYLTNLGYTGRDPQMYASRNLSTDGFIRYLNKLVQEEPQLKQEADKMIQEYVSLMSSVGNNPNLLKTILATSNWSTPNSSDIAEIIDIYNSLKSSKVSRYNRDRDLDTNENLKTVRLREADDDDIKYAIITALLGTAPRHLLDFNGLNGKRASSIMADPSYTGANPLKIVENVAQKNPEFWKLKDKLVPLVTKLTKNIDFTEHFSTESTDQDMSILDFGTSVPKNAYQASQLVGKVDATINAVLDKLEQNFSTEQIAEALRDSMHNDTLAKFSIAGQTISFNLEELDNGKANPFCIRNDDIVFGQYKDVMNVRYNDMSIRIWRHLPAFYGNASAHWGRYMLSLTRSRFYAKHNLSPQDDIDKLEISAADDAYKEAKQIADVSTEKYDSITQSANNLFSIASGDTNGAQSALDKKKVILANLLMTTMQHQINSYLANNATRNSKSKTNQYASDYSGTYDYYSGTVMKELPTASTKYLPVGFYSNRNYDSFTVTANKSAARYRKQEAQTKQSALTERISQKGSITTISKDMLSRQIDSQLHFTPVWSETYIKNLQALRQDSRGFQSDNLTDYANSPLKDILLAVAHNSMYYMPKLRKNVHFSTYVASRLKDHPSSQLDNSPVDPVKLKQARQNCLVKAKFSCKSLSKEDTLGVWSRLQSMYDYKPNETTPEGTRITTPKYTVNSNVPRLPVNKTWVYNTCALLNSPIFEIQDIDYSKYDDEKDRLSDLVDPKCSEEITGFYGGAYSDLHTLPTNFSSKLGAAVQEVGSIRKGFKTKIPNQEQADGIVVVASIMRGENYNSFKNSKTSIITDAKNRTPVDWSIRIRNPDLILPTYIMDISTRIKGYNINVENNQFVDKSTNTTYDSQGISTKINW